MQDFDTLWNYNDPAGTEIAFRQVLEKSSPKSNSGYYLELLTQIARTFSIRMMTDEAHRILDVVKDQLVGQPGVVHVRYSLERGRAFNSGRNKAKAITHFSEAKDHAMALKLDFYAIDALHMLAIASSGQDAIRYNQEAIQLAEQSIDERSQNWLGSLLNNLGWSFFDLAEYDRALSVFLTALEWREQKKSEREIFLAKWCVARTLRALKRQSEAITIQLGLMEEMLRNDSPDGYVYEELAELYLRDNNPLAKMYFGLAWHELNQDVYIREHETARLDRLKDLSK